MFKPYNKIYSKSRLKCKKQFLFTTLILKFNFPDSTVGDITNHTIFILFVVKYKMFIYIIWSQYKCTPNY